MTFCTATGLYTTHCIADIADIYLLQLSVVTLTYDGWTPACLRLFSISQFSLIYMPALKATIHMNVHGTVLLPCAAPVRVDANNQPVCCLHSPPTTTQHGIEHHHHPRPDDPFLLRCRLTYRGGYTYSSDILPRYLLTLHRAVACSVAIPLPWDILLPRDTDACRSISDILPLRQLARLPTGTISRKPPTRPTTYGRLLPLFMVLFLPPHTR